MQTDGSMQAFFLAMALYPEVQQKARAELDAVVGRSRLPDFQDRNALPYINAVVRELVRWHLIVPTGLAHKTTQDGEYLILKNTIVIANSWSVPFVGTSRMPRRSVRWVAGHTRTTRRHSRSRRSSGRSGS